MFAQVFFGRFSFSVLHWVRNLHFIVVEYLFGLLDWVWFG